MNVRKNLLKARLQEGQSVLSCFVRLPEPGLVEILGYAGVDGVILDMEHSAIDWRDAERMITAAFATEITPLVRVPRIAPDVVTRALDIGAQGIIAPHVRTADDARHLQACASFPPRGCRGAAMGRPAKWSAISAQEYFANIEREILVGAMFEDREAVDELPAIAAAGLDVIMFGPADMSASLDLAGQTEHPEVQQISQQLVTATSKTTTVAGIAARNEESAIAALNAGFRFVGLGPAEVVLLRRMQDMIQAIVTTRQRAGS